MTKIATGYKRFAYRLEHYIYYYVPTGWVEHIGAVMTVPFISIIDVQELELGYKQGTLPKAIDYVASMRQPWSKIHNPYVKKAIVDFFNEKYGEDNKG